MSRRRSRSFLRAISVISAIWFAAMLATMANSAVAYALSQEAAIEQCRATIGHHMVQSCMRSRRSRSPADLEACRAQASPRVRACARAATLKNPDSLSIGAARNDPKPVKKAEKPSKHRPVTTHKEAPAPSSVTAPPSATAALTPSPSPAALSVGSKQPVQPYGRRVALIIGNSRYEHVPFLPNARNDAQAFSKTLKESGFEVVTLETDLKRGDMVSTLSTFAKEADRADWAVIYYSGHGIEYRGMNYMIPTDAKLSVDRDIALEAVDIEKVLTTIEGAKRLRLVILDACRDNPFAAQMKRTIASRSVSRGLAPIEPDAGMLIVYSAKHGQTALDGSGDHSPFTAALLNRIKTPSLEIRRLFDLVRDDVMRATNRQQQPFSYGSLSGSEDFYFQNVMPQLEASPAPEK